MSGAQKYFVRKRNPKIAHLWDGEDTVCRMASTGGLNPDQHEVRSHHFGLSICGNCFSVTQRRLRNRANGAGPSPAPAPTGPSNPSIEITPEFQRALDAMHDGVSPLLITGSAGVGKSTLLREFRRQAKKSKRAVVLAPTGVAALNVRGMTIHRFFGFGIDTTPDKVKKPRRGRSQLYKRLKTVIIDEASMLRADLLDCIEIFLRRYGPQPGRLFGGVQMVFIGDLYQLPPVVTAMEVDVMAQRYDSPHFFSARALEGVDVEKIELTRVFRQRDPAFIALLHRLRVNALTDEDYACLAQRVNPRFEPPAGENYITLTGTNQRAHQINRRRLSALTGSLYTHKARVKGSFPAKQYPTQEDLQFKRGAQVMLLNNDGQDRWVNGSIGVIEDLDLQGDEPHVTVSFPGERLAQIVEPYEWELIQFRYRDGKITSERAGAFVQFPFRLAWAVTVHKAQGKTFERMIADLDRVFETGQVYVALSRCTTLEGIVLTRPLRPQLIRADTRVGRFLSPTPADRNGCAQLFGA